MQLSLILQDNLEQRNQIESLCDRKGAPKTSICNSECSYLGLFILIYRSQMYSPS